LVNGHDSTMCDIVWTSPHWHLSSSVSLHVFLQARQWPCAVRNRFNRDHSRRGRLNPGGQIVGSVTRDELITEAVSQDSLHWFVRSRGSMSIQSGARDVRRWSGCS
jgi:hypothetical protein